MDRQRLRAPVAVVAAVAAAQAAVLLMRPREGVIAPAAVSARDYFTQAQIQRARDFRRPQLALYGAGLLVQAGLLVLVVRRPPAALGRPRRRPLVAGAGAAAALSVAATVVVLPLSAISRQRSLDVGLATQAWGDWGADVAKATTIEACLAAAGGGLLVWLMRRFRRHWWAPGSAVAVGLGALFLYAGPVLLDPAFNRFTPLPPGEARSDVLALAREAGVKVGEVYEMDASRRTTAANAYVTGLGATKRVVLYDTLLENFSRDEVRLVVAHELGHVRYRDVPHGLLYLVLVAPLALLAVQRTSERLAPGRTGAAALPAVALCAGVMGTALGIVSSQLSRRVEARADSYSLALTGAPRAFVDFEQRITVRNLADPDPPGWMTTLLATHPPAVERIGTAVAYERQRDRPGAR